MKRTRSAVLATTSVLALSLAACGGGESAGGSSAGGGGFTPRGDVTMIVPFGAGGGSDLAGRATATMIEAAKKSGLPLLPGVMTPSEVMAAREHGFKQLKLFPAVPAGGVGMLNAIAGPLPDVTFCPTGGISIDTAPAFLACKNVACVGGSWLTPKDAMKAGDWAHITALAKAASALRG